MAGMRFTSWLSESERAMLRAVAEHESTSENHILRLALRAALFNKPLPMWLREAVTQVTQITEARTRENSSSAVR